MKIKQFFIDNKSKIKNILENLFNILIFLIIVFSVYSCGVVSGAYFERSEESNKKELVNRRQRVNSSDITYINLLTDEVIDSNVHAYYNANGSLVNSSALTLTNKFRVNSSVSYVYGNLTGQVAYISFFDSNDNFISSTTYSGLLTSPSNAYYCALSVFNARLNDSYFYQGQVIYNYYLPPIQNLLDDEYDEGFDNSLNLLNGNFLSESNLEDLYFYFSDTSEYSYTDIVNSDFVLNRFLKGNYLDYEYLRNYFNGGDFEGLVIDSVIISFKQIVLPINEFTFSLNSFSPTTTFEIRLDNDSLGGPNNTWYDVNISSNGDYYNYDISENFYSLEIFDDMFYNTNFKRLYIESSSYSQGFSNGLTEGKDIGYSNGYDVGFDEGYSNGYREGQLNSGDTTAFFNVFDLIGMGFGVWNPILNMEVIPGFTLGVFIAIPIIVAVVIIVIKLLQR